MSRDRIPELLSAYVDGELTPELRREVEDLLEDSTGAQETMEQYLFLRQELADRAERPPDVTSAVLASIGKGTKRPSLTVKAAAGFAAGVLAGVAFVGLGSSPPSPMAAADVPAEVIAAQTRVDSLSADLRVVERGRHPDVPERQYSGTVSFRSPESLAIRLQDETAYPTSQWVPNDMSHVIDETTEWSRAVAGCPTEALPECTPADARVLATRRREPFASPSVSALDVVVPVGGFVRADTPALVGFQTREGREAIGVRVTAAQLGDLIDFLTTRGNWRAVHPTDRVELWLDTETLVPLGFSVYPAESPDRQLWAIRRGYDDRPDVAVLEVEWQSVEVNGGDQGPLPPIPEEAQVTDAGFMDESLPELDGLVPEGMAEGMTLHRTGRVQVGAGPEVAVAAWTDGRAWLKMEWTTEWTGNRMFGDIGAPGRRVEAGDGFAYLNERGDRVALHGEGTDAVLAGSLPTEELVEVAARVDLTGRRVPSDWAEATSGTLEEAATEVEPLLVPGTANRFSGPAVSVQDGAVSLSYAGAGNRAFVLSQTVGDLLPPPLDADVRSHRVRGRIGRFTPERGLLEWVEDGVIVALRSTTLSLSELTEIADGLEPA